MGKRIRIGFRRMFLKKSTNCSSNFLLIDSNGNQDYPQSTSNIFCGHVRPKPIISRFNSLNILLNIQEKEKFSGFNLQYSVI